MALPQTALKSALRGAEQYSRLGVGVPPQIWCIAWSKRSGRLCRYASLRQIVLVFDSHQWVKSELGVIALARALGLCG